MSKKYRNKKNSKEDNSKRNRENNEFEKVKNAYNTWENRSWNNNSDEEILALNNVLANIQTYRASLQSKKNSSYHEETVEQYEQKVKLRLANLKKQNHKTSGELKKTKNVLFVGIISEKKNEDKEFEEVKKLYNIWKNRSWNNNSKKEIRALNDVVYKIRHYNKLLRKKEISSYHKATVEQYEQEIKLRLGELRITKDS